MQVLVHISTYQGPILGTIFLSQCPRHRVVLFSWSTAPGKSAKRCFWLRTAGLETPRGYESHTFTCTGSRIGNSCPFFLARSLRRSLPTGGFPGFPWASFCLSEGFPVFCCLFPSFGFPASRRKPCFPCTCICRVGRVAP